MNIPDKDLDQQSLKDIFDDDIRKLTNTISHSLYHVDNAVFIQIQIYFLSMRKIKK